MRDTELDDGILGLTPRGKVATVKLETGNKWVEGEGERAGRDVVG